MASMDPELARFIQSGLVVLVASRNAVQHPAVTRGWGPRVGPRFDEIWVSVPRNSSARTLSDAEENGQLAVSFGHPMTLRAVQLKGHCAKVRDADTEALERAAQHFVLFASSSERFGVPRAVTERLFSTDLVTLSMRVEEIYEQTPGTGAGRHL